MTSNSSLNAYEYGEAEYWNARYLEETEVSFDWYQRYSALRPFLRKYISCSSRILVVGCGNSQAQNKSHSHSPLRFPIGDFLTLVPSDRVTACHLPISSAITARSVARLLPSPTIGILSQSDISSLSLQVMSEDMLKDGYVDLMNIDISYIVIEMLRKCYAHIPQLKYMQMDVRDMSLFEDETFDSVIDKGTLDSLMCGTDASVSASHMINEVNRLLKPGGIYMLITYGDPSVRIAHLNQPGCCWKITLYIMPRPDFISSAAGSSSVRSVMEPIPLTENSQIPTEYVLEDPDSHYIYICKKIERSTVSNLL